MHYRSTRGGEQGRSFEQVVLGGLATDGGLYIPEHIPTLTATQLDAWRGLPFAQLAAELVGLYVDPSEISRDELLELTTRSYATFRHADVTPVRALAAEEQLSVLELFHGPTFAFKDVALQLLGNLFAFFLARRNAARPEGAARERVTVVGATSGDTGSAAIYGLRGKQDVSVFILFPRGRVSPVQEQQMTTVPDANVHCVAVEGTFDDCQDIVKQLFGDAAFRARYSLGAVNSINWARILAQIVYYFHAYFQATAAGTSEPVVCSVPSGNFGDILAGYYARRMGLPVRLVCATNSNDILDRFFRTGAYCKAAAGVAQTWAPAMDICVSSNFERLAWYLARDSVSDAGAPDLAASQTVRTWWEALRDQGGFQVAPAVAARARECFLSAAVSDDEVLDTMRRWYMRTGRAGTPYVLDPHTAVGVRAIEKLRSERPDLRGPTLCLATAHPAKFSEAVERALAGDDTAPAFSFAAIQPPELAALAGQEQRCVQVPRADPALVKEVVREGLAAEGVHIAA